MCVRVLLAGLTEENFDLYIGLCIAMYVRHEVAHVLISLAYCLLFHVVNFV